MPRQLGVEEFIDMVLKVTKLAVNDIGDDLPTDVKFFRLLQVMANIEGGLHSIPEQPWDVHKGGIASMRWIEGVTRGIDSEMDEAFAGMAEDLDRWMKLKEKGNN